ncbi:MAG TPA: adenylosuccinate lyase [Chloroflexi bacterium]|nr:adenylosuccinate lyase [Chloroflexota bacterium]|tara:strand:+ start:3675 stop:5084 length:1410 start_codon:yes stop_codon:yes gene_type:complete
MSSFSYDDYVSPFTWRYGSNQMRELWSEIHKRKLLRRVWYALARAQCEHGLVTSEQLDDLYNHIDDVNIERSLIIEKTIKHDLMAELNTYAEQCEVGGSVLHLGATSMDILDNADVLRIKSSLELIINGMVRLRDVLADKIDDWASITCIGFTHLQPAEPTTVGYRLAQYGQDLLVDYDELVRVLESLCGKGFKGAVGTSASYLSLLDGDNEKVMDLERRAMDFLGINSFTVSTQTYPRKQDWFILNALSGLGATLYRFAFDIRILQSPLSGELSENFSKHQVGSSAMPFKSNPINSEKIDSLSRYLAALPRVAWDNASHSLLERTLDDSANRRILFPQAFLIVDELLNTIVELVEDLHISTEEIDSNMNMYKEHASIEPLLMALCKAGADRQEMHELLRTYIVDVNSNNFDESLEDIDLIDKLASDETLLHYVSSETIRQQLVSIENYVGLAPDSASIVAKKLRNYSS